MNIEPILSFASYGAKLEIQDCFAHYADSMEAVRAMQQAQQLIVIDLEGILGNLPDDNTYNSLEQAVDILERVDNLLNLCYTGKLGSPVTQLKEESSMNTIDIIDYYADWCHPCKMLTPILHQVALELSTREQPIGVQEIDIVAYPDLGAGILSLPTVVIKVNGEEKERFSGFRTPVQVKRILAPYVGITVE